MSGFGFLCFAVAVFLTCLSGLNIGGGLFMPGFGFLCLALAVFLTCLGSLNIGAGVCRRLGLTLSTLIVAF